MPSLRFTCVFFHSLFSNYTYGSLAFTLQAELAGAAPCLLVDLVRGMGSPSGAALAPALSSLWVIIALIVGYSVCGMHVVHDKQP